MVVYAHHIPLAETRYPGFYNAKKSNSRSTNLGNCLPFFLGSYTAKTRFNNHFFRFFVSACGGDSAGGGTTNQVPITPPANVALIANAGTDSKDVFSTYTMLSLIVRRSHR
jgi:hypothetical protein